MKVYIMINCELTEEKTTAKIIQSMKNVIEVNPTFGAYDMIVVMESNSLEELQDSVKEVRRLESIRSTMTLTRLEK